MPSEQISERAKAWLLEVYRDANLDARLEKIEQLGFSADEQAILRAIEASLSPSGEGVEAEALAQRFHETYERLAPSFGYETREASAKPWADVPDQNKRLMIAVCGEILAALAAENEGLRAGLRDVANAEPIGPRDAISTWRNLATACQTVADRTLLERKPVA